MKTNVWVLVLELDLQSYTRDKVRNFFLKIQHYEGEKYFLYKAM